MALHVVILAAGKGTRMKSSRPKVLHGLAGRPIIDHVLRTAESLGAESTIVVIGHGADDVRSALASRALSFVVQSPQLGTGHALRQAEPALKGQSGTVLLLYGDVPLLQTNTLSRLLDHHRAKKAAATILTTDLAEPYGYGRIVRDAEGQVARVVEERDASGEERTITEINSGVYAFDLAPLFASLQQLATDNSQGEYYLTDLVAMYRQRGLAVETLNLDSAWELRGVNNRADLSELSAIVRQRRNHEVMLSGVTLEDPPSTFIDADVHIGADTVLGPGVRLQGTTRVGERCQIQAGTRITDSEVGNDVVVLDHSVILGSRVGDGARIGPFAHVRPDSLIGNDAHVGNFVELKKTTLGRKSKANHLAYLGDATIGEGVNIGAGTITCNYDGVAKHPTIIEDGVFIGSDSQLVAPVRIGAGAYVAAGSSITKDVPAGALGIARAKQENKPGWAAERRASRSKGKS